MKIADIIHVPGASNEQFEEIREFVKSIYVPSDEPDVTITIRFPDKDDPNYPLLSHSNISIDNRKGIDHLIITGQIVKEYNNWKSKSSKP